MKLEIISAAILMFSGFFNTVTSTLQDSEYVPVEEVSYVTDENGNQVAIETSRYDWRRRRRATPQPSATATATARPTPTPIKTTPSPVALPSTQGRLKWGAAFPEWQPEAVGAFESMIGKPIDYYATFVHWGNEKDFPMLYSGVVRDAGKTMVIFWEAKDYNVPSVNQTQYNFDAVLSGKWDSYFTQFAKDARTYGGPVILIPYSESNDNSGPWGGQVNGNTVEKFKLAYQYITKFFNDAPNVKFGWAMNNVSSPQTDDNKIERYYPGDEYVDIVGVDGFNFGTPWQTWDQVFGSVLTMLSQYNKPILIASTASKEGPEKPQWIIDGFGTQIKKYPLVIGWVWFNERKERDWRVNSDAATLEAFKKVLP